MNSDMSTAPIAYDDKIFVAGHRGLVGSALVRRLRSLGYTNLLQQSRTELDLLDGVAVQEFMHRKRPRHVYLAAAKVGGIHANNVLPAEFIYQNLLIQTNVIHAAYKAGVERLLFLGSSCIYPKLAPQPIKEEYLLSGQLESTNSAYALAKIAGIEMCWSYNKQYGTRYMCAMPTNLYGPGDNYDLQNSHVIPALIRKMHEAKLANARHVVVWGTGTPRREFLYSDDLADACVFAMNLPADRYAQLATVEERPLINIGVGEDQTIAELARLIADVVGFKGMIEFDTTKPDGTPRKLLDVSKLSALGWRAPTGLRDGLVSAYRDFHMHASLVTAGAHDGAAARS